MTEEELKAAAKAAWDAGDYELAAHHVAALRELHPPEQVVQNPDGTVTIFTP